MGPEGRRPSSTSVNEVGASARKHSADPAGKIPIEKETSFRPRHRLGIGCAEKVYLALRDGCKTVLNGDRNPVHNQVREVQFRPDFVGDRITKGNGISNGLARCVLIGKWLCINSIPERELAGLPHSIQCCSRRRYREEQAKPY